MARRTFVRRAHEPFIRRVELFPPDPQEEREGYPWELPAVLALRDGGFAVGDEVTFLVGENGSGKSTVIEAMAVAAGMNPEGGSSNFAFETRRSHSVLGRGLRLVRGATMPQTDFFLRAESLFTAATYLDELGADDDGRALQAYGGASLHEQSHGESFLSVLMNRFGPGGLYLLDEPEAALSTQNCLTCLRRMHELVRQRSQFIVATHSPVLLAYPGATIYLLDDDGISRVTYDDAPPVVLTRGFLDAPERYLRGLLED
jgi:predicted ATPase